MRLTGGVHHIATVTADIDRLVAFYADVLGAPMVQDMREERLRHVFIELGAGVLLHPFQIPGVEVPQGELPAFGRGRIDHIALKAETLSDLEAARRRIVGAGAGDGEGVDMGSMVSVGFLDPDGLWGELCWDRPDREPFSGSERENWIRWPYPEPIPA